MSQTMLSGMHATSSRILQAGTYRVFQKSTERYVDTDEGAFSRLDMVTREAELTIPARDTQRWIVMPMSIGVFRIQQASTNRFVDAHEHDDNGRDYGAATRSYQDNETQLWVVEPVDDNTVTLRQLSSGRFLDAHEHNHRDNAMVTRPRQTSANERDTQHWVLNAVGDASTYTMMQASSGQFADAYENDDPHEFRMVTRTRQSNKSQNWHFTLAGGIYRLQQTSSGLYVDAYQSDDHKMVVRQEQDNDTQLWAILPLEERTYRLVQVSSGRHADAHDVPDHDYRMATRPRQDSVNERFSQYWTFEADG